MGKVNQIGNVGQLYTFAHTGIVVGNATWSETRVSSTTSGGGGHLNQGTGYVAAPTTYVSSSSTEVSRFFLRKADGDETEISLKGADFGVRDGHLVTVAFAGDHKSKLGWPMSLYNHNTRSRETLTRRFAWLRGEASANTGCVMLLPAIFGGYFAGLLLNGIGGVFGSAVGIVAMIVLMTARSRKRQSIDRAIQREMDALIDAAIIAAKEQHAIERRATVHQIGDTARQ